MFATQMPLWLVMQKAGAEAGGMKYPSTGEEVTDKVLTRSDPTFLGVLHHPTNNHHGLHTMK